MTEIVTKILDFCYEWALLVTLENVITFGHNESFKIYFIHAVLSEKITMILKCTAGFNPKVAHVVDKLALPGT
jgi:hypothetical protein